MISKGRENTLRRFVARFSDATTSISNEMLAKKTINSTLAHVALASVAVVGLPSLEAQVSWPAIAILFFCLFGRVVVGSLYLSKRFHDEVSFRQFYGLLTFLIAVCWSGYLVAVLLSHGQIDHVTVLPIILIGGVAVAGTTALSPDKHLSRLFVSALLLPPALVLLSPWAPNGVSLGITLLTSLLFLLSQVELQAKTLQAFRDREEKYRALTAATQEMVVIHENGEILEVNNAVEQILGWTPAEMIGTNILGHTPIEDRAHNTEILSRIHNRTLVVRCVRKDGLVFHAEIYSRFFEYRGRRAKITCLRSIEDRLMAEKAIRESSLQIEAVARDRETTAIETARLKSEFLANMSHEIRTPLNAIIGITDLMADLVTTTQQKRYLRTLGDSSESLLSLVNDILDFSKIDADKMEFEKIDFSVGNLIESQADLLSARAQQKGLVIVAGIDPDLPLTLRGDSGRIGQILLNLIGNAIKFTEAGF
ncbi:MAG: PAS domain S-box protein, partial [Proteobacteria bacterium]